MAAALQETPANTRDASVSPVSAFVAEAARRDKIMNVGREVELLVAKQNDEGVKKGKARIEPTVLLNGLEQYVTNCRQNAYDYNNRWLRHRLADCVRRYHGEYHDWQLQQLRNIRSCEHYIGYTGVKTRAGESWIKEIYGDAMRPTPIPLKPSPIPQVSPQEKARFMEQLQQEMVLHLYATGQAPTPDQITEAAKTWRKKRDVMLMDFARERARRHEKVLAMEWSEGGFEREFDTFIKDLFIYPSAIMRTEYRNVWREVWDAKGQPVLMQVPTLCGRHVSPWDFYPSPQCSRVGDGYAMEWRRVTRQDVDAMRGVRGYNDDRIKEALKRAPSDPTLYTPYEMDRLIAEGKDLLPTYGSSDDRYDMTDFWGGVLGEYLLDWGWNEERDGKLDRTRTYPVNVVMLGQFAIKATLNPFQDGLWPFFVSSFERVPDSIWGKALPEVVTAGQDAINLSGRQIYNNVGITGGPQVVANVDSMHPSGLGSLGLLVDRKIWLTQHSGMTGASAPVQFMNIESRVRENKTAFELGVKIVDDLSGIPSYTYGDDQMGRSSDKTAMGLRLRIAMASRGIRQVATNVNQDIFKPMGQYMVRWNNRFHPDRESIIGDIEVDVEGLGGAQMREDVQAKREALFDKAMVNPAIAQTIGPAAVRALTEEVFDDADLDNVLQPEAEAPQQQMPQQLPQGQSPAPSPQPAPMMQ